MAGNYSFVIVGAGSAGCVLANRLSADPACEVALLEAGGPDRKREIRVPAAFTKLFLTGYDWNYRTTKQPQLSDREVYWPRGRTLGGSSSINAQAWTRGHRADYEGWAQSCPGWSYEEVRPYFQRAEHRVGSNAGGVYGTSGPQFISELRDPNPTTSAFLAACAELGLRRLGELNEPDNTGYSPTPVTQRRGLRHSTADAYLRPTRRRRNLTVLTAAHAQRILLDGTRATGVEYRDAAGVTQRITASREVILSAGAINSPQLLMLSGIGDADRLRAAGVEPRHDMVGVGANLQDHLACGVIVHCPKPITLAAADSPVQLIRFLLARRGMLTSSVNEAVAFVRSDPALAAPDVELVWLPVPFLGEGMTAPPGHGLTLAVVLLQPASRGDISLASGDPAEPPVIDPGYLTAESDLRGLVAGVRIAERVCDTAALRPYVGASMAPYPGKVDDAKVATLIREYAQTAYHPVGTCRMGSDDAAVVDCELRVRGLQGLRVVDASVMPRIIRGHTHAPTVMIAERAADLIRASKVLGAERETQPIAVWNVGQLELENKPTLPTHPDQVHRRYDRMVRAAGGQSGFIRTRSGRVHVIEAGDGPPVVHLHGNNTSSLSHLMLLDHMTTVRSYLVDRPGSGLSDPASFPRDSFRQCAVRFVDDVLDQLHLERAVLAGASGGGTWALWYALDRPERVHGLVMLGSIPLLPGARIPMGIRLMATPLLGQVLSRTMKPGRRMLMRLMSSMREAETILRYPDLLDSLVDAAHDPVAMAANVAEFQALLSPLGPRTAVRIRPDDLRRVAVRTLMIWGDRDPVVSVADARAAAELIPHAHLEVLPAGHVPQLGHPARVAELLTEFTRAGASDG